MESAFCPFCGCGCKLDFQGLKRGNDNRGGSISKFGQIEKTLPDKSDPVSMGRPCLKGLSAHETLNSERLNIPMIRRNKSEKLQKVSWEEAYDFIKGKLEELGGGVGNLDRDPKILRDKVYFMGSGEATNEANYLLSKLSRTYFQSNNIDSCARLCHAATAVGFDSVFGIKAIPEYTMDDLKRSDSFLFIGTDPMDDYPVMFHRVMEAKKNGALITVVDVAGSGTSQQADHFFKISPYGIISMIAHLVVRLVDGGDISRDAKLLPGFSEFVESAREIAAEKAPSTFGFTKQKIDDLYRIVNDSKKLTVGFGMGLTQHKTGTENVTAAAGLSILLDAVIFPNRGKINVQGASDVGADPGWRPSRDSKWKAGFDSHDGLPSTESLYSDDVELLWVMGSNPSQSMPDLNSLDESFKKKFIVYQHHHAGRTMEFADVVLPALTVSEEFGSVTNGERRVRGIFGAYQGEKRGEEFQGNRRITIGGGDSGAKPNWLIIAEFAGQIEAEGFEYSNAREIFNEITHSVADYEKLEINRVESQEGQFANKKAPFKQFVKLSFEREHFQEAADFPFIFTTARSKFHFCTGEGTRSSKTLTKMGGEPEILMNPADAESLEIQNGSNIRVFSSVGEITGVAKIDPEVEKRVLVAPYHFEKLLVNRLTPRDLDPKSSTPCYKEVWVGVEKLTG